MSKENKMLKIGGNPKGLIGKLVGHLMNILHMNIYKWALDEVKPSEKFYILDIGCGGGKAIKLISKKFKNPIIYGIDHSEEMITLATRVNDDGIKSYRVKLLNTSVEKLPFDNGTFNYATAFETIQFWPNITENLKGIHKVLKPNGQLIIANQLPEENSKWCQNLQLKSIDDYKKVLEQSSFKMKKIDYSSKKGWILIVAEK